MRPVRKNVSLDGFSQLTGAQIEGYTWARAHSLEFLEIVFWDLVERHVNKGRNENDD